MQNRSRIVLTTLLVVFICVIGIMISSRLLDDEDVTLDRSLAQSSVRQAKLKVDLQSDTHELDGYGVSANIHYPGFIDLFVDDNDMYEEVVESFKSMGFDYIRFPNGNEIVFYDWRNPKDSYVPWGNIHGAKLPSVEEMLRFANDTESKVVYEVPMIGFFPEEASNSNTSLAGDTYFAGSNKMLIKWSEEDLREFVKRYTIDRYLSGSNYISIYELGNEDYFIRNDRLNRLITEEEYFQVALKVSSIIKSELEEHNVSEDKVEIVGVTTREKDSIWNSDRYRANDKFFDSIAFHTYWKNRTNWKDADSLYGLYTKRLEFLQFSNIFEGVPKYQSPTITEWNYWCWNDIHKKTQRYEQFLYNFGFLILSNEYNSSINSYLGYSPDNKNICNVYKKDGEFLELATSGLAFKEYHSYSGKSFVSTEINSDVKRLPTKSSELEIDHLLSGATMNEEYLFIYVLNRSIYDYNLDLSIDSSSSFTTYSSVEYSAPGLDSPVEEIIIKNNGGSSLEMNSLNELYLKPMSLTVLRLEKACAKDCENRKCGPDSCGGTCGTCKNDYQCIDGECRLINQNHCKGADISGGDGNAPDNYVTVADISYVLRYFDSFSQYEDDNEKVKKADIWGPQQKADGYVNAYDISLIINKNCFDSERKRPLN